MSVESALRQFLIDDAALNDIIAGRVFALRLPQKPTYPTVSFVVISRQDGYTYEGQETLSAFRVQFDCWAADYDEARRVADTLNVALGSFRGLMGSVPVGGVFRVNEFTRYDGDVDKVAVSVDFRLWFQQPSP